LPRLGHLQTANKVNERLRVAAGLGVSALVLAAVIVVASALGTSIVGVPTSYGNGVDPRLGAQVLRDFLADQQAEATAISTGDQTPLGGRFTDSGLSYVIQLISTQTASGAPPTVTFQPSSLTVLRAADPGDPALTLEVREDGSETVVTTPGPTASPTEQTISFHGDYWLRVPSGSHYAIADINFQTLPSSPLPALALVGAALVVVAMATLLVVRQRDEHPAAIEPADHPVPVPPPADLLPDGEAAPVPSGPAPGMVVSTFGGLHIREGGTDWAQELMARPVTGFVWLRLLVAAINDPAAKPSREELARQATPPGLSREVQLKRLRNVVARGLPEMPAPLRGRILVEPEAMSFRLEDCAVDAIELLAISAECAGVSQLSPAQANRVQPILQTCRGDFLPEFDTVENIATDRHPSCTALVAELRELLINTRADLSLLLADSHLRGGRPLQSIAILEAALSDRSGRKDIADHLAAAYRAAGRDSEARALEARYA
jgi:hypothetical protein